MSEERKIEIAKQYVDQQLETLRNFASAPPDMSEEEYRGLISDVAELVEA